MMGHAMIDKSTSEQLQQADDHADWLLDAIACATQDRRFLRGDPDGPVPFHYPATDYRQDILSGGR